ncbi:MAG: hypothetical protein WCA12_11670 [Burkholderiales bacterium]
MSPDPKPTRDEAVPPTDLQHGDGRSPARDEQLKRVIKQHPQRDEPRVDSVEEDETPPT